MKRKLSFDVSTLAFIFADADFFNDNKIMFGSDFQIYDYLCSLYNSLSSAEKKVLRDATMSKLAY